MIHRSGGNISTIFRCLIVSAYATQAACQGVKKRINLNQYDCKKTFCLSWLFARSWIAWNLEVLMNSKLTNQCARKTLFTYVVYCNIQHWLIYNLSFYFISLSFFRSSYRSIVIFSFSFHDHCLPFVANIIVTARYLSFIYNKGLLNPRSMLLVKC